MIDLPLKARVSDALASAVRHYQSGQLEEAEVLCSQILGNDSANPDALFMLGLVASQKRDYGKAVEYLSRAAAISGNNIPCLVALGDAFYSLGMVAEAGKIYFDALTLNPEVATLHYAYAHTLYEMGRTEDAIAEYKRSIDLQPDLAKAYYGLGVSLFDDMDLMVSRHMMEKALQYHPGMVFARFGAAMISDLQDRDNETSEHFGYLADLPWLRDCWNYVATNKRPNTRLFSSTFRTLRYGLETARKDGQILEFGVRAGLSIRYISSLVEQTVHGFDSFEGLPESWESMPAGVYSVHGKLPEVPENVQLHVGWFEDTLPRFLEDNRDVVRFINMDCDIYSSTKTVLDNFRDRIVEGTVIVFDEYLMNPLWREDEYKAFQEAVKEYSWSYEYIAFSLFSKQAAVRIVP